MMRPGKDYVTKDASEAEPEYESDRARHLRELCRNIAAQGGPPVSEDEEVPADDPKPVNQAKPTLKLK